MFLSLEENWFNILLERIYFVVGATCGRLHSSTIEQKNLPESGRLNFLSFLCFFAHNFDVLIFLGEELLLCSEIHKVKEDH